MTSLDFACCVSNLRIHEEKLSLSFDTSFGFRWFCGFAYFAPRQFEETLIKLTQTRLGKSHFLLVHRQMQQVRLTSAGPLTTTDNNPSQDQDDQSEHKFTTLVNKKLKQTQVDAEETEYLKHALLDANIY